MKNMNHLNKKTLAALSLVAIMAATTVGAFASTDSGNCDTSRENRTQTVSTWNKTTNLSAMKINHATTDRKIVRTGISTDSHNLFMNRGTEQTKLAAERALLRDKAKRDKDMKNEKDAKNKKSDKNDKRISEKAMIAANIAAMPTLKPLYVQLDALKATEKANHEADRVTSTSIRLSMKTLRHSMEGLTPAAIRFVYDDLKSKTVVVRGEIQAKNTEIHTLQKTMNAERVIFKAAVLAKNETSAAASLTRIVSLKTRIIAKNADMALLMTKFANILKSYVLPVIPATLTPAA